MKLNIFSCYFSLKRPPRTQQVPRSDDLTIYFHAIISKDFKLNSTDRIFLRSGSLFGTWDIDGPEMSVTRYGL